MTKFLMASALFIMVLSNAVSLRADEALYEMRVYTPEPGRRADMLKLMEGTGRKFLAIHKLDLVGAWTPTDPADERVVTLIKHADRKSCDAAWSAFQADPAWQSESKAAAIDGKMPVKGVERIFLTVNDYSPELKKEDVGNRVFELRTYIATPNNLSALNKRFKNHTLGLFQKHGMTNVVYWSIAKAEPMPAAKLLNAVSPVGKGNAEISAELPADGNALVYFITHKSEDAAKGSFDSFGKDDAWKKARTESEQAAGGSLTAGGAVKSWFLKPTAFSPLK
jgi:hypothetical protein